MTATHRNENALASGVTDWVVAPDDASQRLDVFLAAEARLGTRGRANRALTRGKVLLNGRDAGPADGGRRLVAGDCVRLWMDRPGSARTRLRHGGHVDGGLQIVFEDDALIVVNKPAGLLTVPLARRAEASSVFEQLSAHLRTKGKRRPLVVHRIDRDTSGLVVFAATPAAQRALKDQFVRHEPVRVYLAVVAGVPAPTSGEWRDYLAWDDRALAQTVTDRRDPRAREGHSRYVVREAYPRAGAALLEVQLVTGKRNQIRVQAEQRGHPLVGEQMYAAGAQGLEAAIARQALHAWRLSFAHPASGRLISIEAPMPADLVKLIGTLRAHERKSEKSRADPRKKATMRPHGYVRRPMKGKE